MFNELMNNPQSSHALYLHVFAEARDARSVMAVATVAREQVFILVQREDRYWWCKKGWMIVEGREAAGQNDALENFISNSYSRKQGASPGRPECRSPTWHWTQEYLN